MKKILPALAAAFTLGACSGSASNPDSGVFTDAGFTTITYTTVDVHPAAKTALPSTPAITAGYSLVLNGVGINPAMANPIVLTPIGHVDITSTTGPYAFTIYNGDIPTIAPLGILAGINPQDAGAIGDGGLPEWSCADLGTFLDGGHPALPDYLVPSGSQVGGTANPPSADVPNAQAFAVPMSYSVLLTCANTPRPAKSDLAQGTALVYVTDNADPTKGKPIQGVSFAVKGAANTPTVTYYADYASTTTTGTDATGVATVVNVQTGAVPPTLSSTDSAGDKFFVPGLATESQSFFNVFVNKE